MTIWTPTHHNSMYSKLQAALEKGLIADSEVNMNLDSDSELERAIKNKQKKRRADPWVISEETKRQLGQGLPMPGHSMGHRPFKTPLVSSDVQAEGDLKKREIKQAEKMSPFG